MTTKADEDLSPVERAERWQNAPPEVRARHAESIVTELRLKRAASATENVGPECTYKREVRYSLTSPNGLVHVPFVALYFKARQEWHVFESRTGKVNDQFYKLSAAVVSPEEIKAERSRQRAMDRDERRRADTPIEPELHGTLAEKIREGVERFGLDETLRLIRGKHPELYHDVDACPCGAYAPGWRVPLHHHLRHLAGHGRTAAKLAAAVEEGRSTWDSI